MCFVAEHLQKADHLPRLLARTRSVLVEDLVAIGERPTFDVISDSLHAVGVDGLKVVTSGCTDGVP